MQKATQARREEKAKKKSKKVVDHLLQHLGPSDLSPVTTPRKEYVPNVDSYSPQLLCAVTGVPTEKGLVGILDPSSEKQEETRGIYRRDSVLRQLDKMSKDAGMARYYLSEEQRMRIVDIVPAVTGAIAAGSYINFMQQVARFKSVPERSYIFQEYGEYYKNVAATQKCTLELKLFRAQKEGKFVMPSELQPFKRRLEGLKKIERAIELQNIILGLTTAVEQASWSKFEQQLRRFELTPAETQASKKTPKEEQAAVFIMCGQFLKDKAAEISLELKDEDSGTADKATDIPKIWRCLNGESVVLRPDSVPKIDMKKVTGV